MGILRFMKNAGRLARTMWTPDEAPSWITSSDSVSGMLNIAGTSKPAEHVLMVFACIMARREAVGSVPARLVAGDDNIVESGPVFDLLRKPNSQMNWGQYIRVIETHNTLYNAIMVAKVGNPEQPDELMPLNPGYMEPERGVHLPTGVAVATGWTYHDPYGSTRRFRPDELIIHVGYNPHAPLAPLSPVKVLEKTMKQELAAREMNLAYALNDATPPLILESDKSLDEKTANMVLGRFIDRFGGYRNRRKPAILWGGLKAKEVGITPAEMEYLAGLKFLRTDYYMTFRVTPAMVFEMLGETGLSQGSSTDEQNVRWWENVGFQELGLIAELHQTEVIDKLGASGSMRAMHTREAASLRRALARRPREAGGNKLYLYFDENQIPCLIRSRLGKLDQAVKLAQLGYRPDEVNDYLDLGLPPHPDNIGRVPFSLQPVGEEALPEPPATEPAAGEKQERQFRMLDRIEELMREEVKIPAKWKPKRAAFDKLCAGLERAAAKKYSRAYFEQRARVLKRISPALARAGDDPLEGKPADWLARIFPKSQEDAALMATIRPLVSEELKSGWEFFHMETGSDLKKNPFEVDDDRVQEALERRAIKGASINDTTQDALHEIISAAFDEGDTEAQLADRIDRYYKDNCLGDKAHRPTVAARTQVAGIVNEGRLLAAQDAGGLKKGWLHGGSADPRDAHIAAQATYLASPIGLEEKFTVNGYECDAPGSTELPVEEVANCTCMLTFVKG